MVQQTQAVDESALLAPDMYEAEQDSRFMVRRIAPSEALKELELVGFDPTYRHHAVHKYDHWVFKAYDLSPAAMNILKQECIAVGAEAGVHREAITCKVDRAPVLITATRSQLSKLLPRLMHQPFSLSKLAHSLERLLKRNDTLKNRPVEGMAVINMTPDSFSDGGLVEHLEDVVGVTQRALDHGCTWVDVGGESTRPGAPEVALDEELKRVIPAIEMLRHSFPGLKISVDTRKAKVASAALEAGATMVNDVSGFQFDTDMSRVVADAGCPVVIMHSQGTPQTMQLNPSYDDVVGEIAEFLYRQVDHALSVGINLEQIILDPGYGFGKTLVHNMELLRRLPEITSIGFPVLVATSRKSFLAMNDPGITLQDREVLTGATTALAIEYGAKIIRFHDPELQMPVLKLLNQIKTG